MGAMARRILGGVGALALLVAGTTALAVHAAASPAPWTWKRVVQYVYIEPYGNYFVDATCPAGFTAVTGGLSVPKTSTVHRNAEYRVDDGTVSAWFVNLENPTQYYGDAWVIAECVERADLPPISHDWFDFPNDQDGIAEGAVYCPNAGEVVLTGGAEWNNANTRSISQSGPVTGGQAWIARGWNSIAGAKLTVEVYCVDPSQVPGFQMVQVDYTVGGYWETSISCPQGKRILNGGTERHVDGVAYASYPSYTKWTSTGHHGSGAATYLRAYCIDAGTPTVEITGATPGPEGAVTGYQVATFTLTGTDPAGYPPSFTCAVDSDPLVHCYSGSEFGPLDPGSHTFVVWNTTPDGRSSGLVTYHWTIDIEPPTVTVKKLSPVTLAKTAVVQWTGSDQGSSIDHYQAAYWLGHVDGTSTPWTYPAEWSDLASTSVRTPTLAKGDSICVAVSASDLAGNIAPWSAPTCTSRPLDDRALTASTGWTRATGSSYWLSTVTTTTATNKTLTRANVHLSRVGVLATVCPTCGVVAVKVGSTTIGQIDLSAGATHHQRVLLLPAFTARTGTVTVKSVSSGESIRIDGLVVIQESTGTP